MAEREHRLIKANLSPMGQEREEQKCEAFPQRNQIDAKGIKVIRPSSISGQDAVS